MRSGRHRSELEDITQLWMPTLRKAVLDRMEWRRVVWGTIFRTEHIINNE